ncbi:ABC transporter A family member 8 [Galdieria sulphuraria]|nr:ABC transporter A family member 8 [Galdieria sulphuraria]
MKKAGKKFAQTQALLLKTWNFQKRQHGENACNILVPIVLLVLTYILGKVLGTGSRVPVKSSRANPIGAFAPMPFDPYDCHRAYSDPELCLKDPFAPKPILFPYWAANETIPGLVEYESCDPLKNETLCLEIAGKKKQGKGVFDHYSLYPMIYPGAIPPANFSKEQNSYDGIYLYKIFHDEANNSIYNATIQAQNASVPYIDNVYALRVEPFASADQLKQEIYHSFYNQPFFAKYYGGYIIDQLNVKNVSLNISALVLYNQTLLNWPSASISQPAARFCDKGNCELISGVMRLSDALYRYFTAKNTRIFNYLRKFPRHHKKSTIDFIQLVVSILLGFLLHFPLPTFLRYIVYERENRLRDIMQMMGLSFSTYWIVTYISFLLLYIVVAGVTTIVGVILQLEFFMKNTPLMYLILFFLWGNNLIAFAMMLAPFLPNVDTAVIFGWFYVIVVNFLGAPYTGKLYTYRAESSLLFAICFLPSFAFFRVLYYVGEINDRGYGLCVSGCYVANFKNGIRYPLGMCSGPSPVCTVYVFLIVEWFIFLVLGLYFDQVISYSGRDRKHPLFFLVPLKRIILSHKGKNDVMIGTTGGPDKSKNSSEGFLERVDGYEDIRNEHEVAEQSLQSLDYGLSISHLSKWFPGRPPKKAVNDLSLAIRKNEVFGLLGHNGAGKTTTMNIVVGQLQADRGKVIIDGFDLKRERKHILSRLGICPQFDILWSDLTGKEHLYFYCRLRGIIGKECEKEVESSLASVQLESAANRVVKKYSGGMRRRLSVAVSLIGFPSVVLLDEPSTGLDPDSKHKLWQCIQQRKEGKTIVLTTHSMEEAERLCDRTGIMANGSLKCIGSPEELKIRLGKGFRLNISCPRKRIQSVRSFIEEQYPEAFLDHSLAGSIIFWLPRNISIASVFELMEKVKDELSIQDWGISQSTLEDVFISVTRDEERKSLSVKIE